MSMTEISLKRPITLLMASLGVIVLGVQGLFGMPLELNPTMEMPMFMVSTYYPNATPEEVDRSVTSVIERALGTVRGLEDMYAYSSENYSTVQISLDYDVDSDDALKEIQKKVDDMASSLPDEASSPNVMQFSSENATVAYGIIVSDTYENLGAFAEDEIAPEFEKLLGIASVDINGADWSYIQVEINEQNLNKYDLTIDMVSQIIKSNNMSIPSGQVERGDQKILLTGDFKIETVEDIKNLPITLKTGDVINISDVANVSIQTMEKESYSRHNGEPTIGIWMEKRQNADAVDLSRDIEETALKIMALNPDIEIDIIETAGEYIESAISSVTEALLAGGVIAMIVLWVLMGDIKAALIVAISMPLSVIGTFALMDSAGLTLNMISLGGLIVGIGMVVDNSIVVLESMYRKRNEGMSYIEAARQGVKTVVSAIVASTLTTIIVFLPISLIDGMTGQMFSQAGFTIVFSLLSSLICALTLVPALYVIIKPVEKVDGLSNRFMTWVENKYEKGITRALKWRRRITALAVISLIGSLVLIPLIGFELMPEMAGDQVRIRVTTKKGTTADKTDEYVKAIELAVKDMEEVESYAADSHSGSGSVTVTLKEDKASTTEEIANIIRDKTSHIIGADIKVDKAGGGFSMGGGASVGFSLQGKNLDDLKEGAIIVEDMVKAHADIVDTTVSLADGNPIAKIVIDPLKAAGYSLSNSQIIGQIRGITGGIESSDISITGVTHDIIVEYPDGSYDNVNDLKSVMINSPVGPVPLMDLASFEFTNGASQIVKMNNQYLVSITGQVANRNANDVQMELLRSLEKEILPSGVKLQVAGSNEAMMEELMLIVNAMVLSVALVFMIMAAQFESIPFSLNVMMTVPFSAIGALLALYITGQTINMTSMVGATILIGVVINNSIVLIDYTGQLRAKGMDVEEALVLAGKTRLRPILMATATTVLAMVPMAVNTGDGGEMMQPMGIVVIGGLLCSTLLTLFLIPSIYSLSANKVVKRKLKRRLKKEKKRAAKKAKEAKQA